MFNTAKFPAVLLKVRPPPVPIVKFDAIKATGVVTAWNTPPVVYLKKPTKVVKVIGSEVDALLIKGLSNSTLLLPPQTLATKVPEVIKLLTELDTD